MNFINTGTDERGACGNTAGPLFHRGVLSIFKLDKRQEIW